jgi:hypothetical protein
MDALVKSIKSLLKSELKEKGIKIKGSRLEEIALDMANATYERISEVINEIEDNE